MENQTLDIQETIYKGKIRPFGKTKGSLTKVPIAKELAKELGEWREQGQGHITGGVHVSGPLGTDGLE